VCGVLYGIAPRFAGGVGGVELRLCANNFRYCLNACEAEILWLRLGGICSRIDVTPTGRDYPRLDRKSLVWSYWMNFSGASKVAVQPAMHDKRKLVDVREECPGMSYVNPRTN
jgi:hypothetical protein